jgi:putative oxidoreductase
MLYEGKTALEILSQILIASLFLGTLTINATSKVEQHLDRMRAMGLPFPCILLWVGFSIQAVGSTMLVLDIRPDIGASLLIIFTIIATIIFHRFWGVKDPLRRHLHVSLIFSNLAIVGALLLLIES